jgi:hypothetical protein
MGDEKVGKAAEEASGRRDPHRMRNPSFLCLYLSKTLSKTNLHL